jgi:ubiquinone/menaquinone biosynthesis C-methylase UbiE
MIGKHNEPFNPEEIGEIENSIEAKELKDLAEELYKKGLITTSAGHLKKGMVKHFFSPEYLWAYVKTIQGCELKSGMKVLDLGGASTPIVFWCAKKGLDITTIDQQSKLVENTSKIAGIMGWNNLKAIRGDMTDTKLAENSFDAVFSVAVIHFLPKDVRKKAMREMARVVKPGGKIGIIFDFGKGTGRKGNYDEEYYNSQHDPLRDAKEIEETFFRPEVSLIGNQDLSEKIHRDKSAVRKSHISDALKRMSLKRILALPYLLVNSPYFKYTFYSIFLRKL